MVQAWRKRGPTFSDGRLFLLLTLPEFLDFKLFGKTVLVVDEQVWRLSGL